MAETLKPFNPPRLRWCPFAFPPRYTKKKLRNILLTVLLSPEIVKLLWARQRSRRYGKKSLRLTLRNCQLNKRENHSCGTEIWTRNEHAATVSAAAFPYFSRATCSKDLSSKLRNIAATREDNKNGFPQSELSEVCVVRPETSLIYVCLLLIIMECKYEVNTNLLRANS